ncbi:MAG: ABC transporter permease [Armatimonadota bacterium]|nr:ABC transporter permease [Armatimonadota bacterium]MDR7488506.1 ABC transporter permease [Armatimonadota bacterium]MDR7573803.1 ABC transporter permease [Armatimonadota bacterium]MDR7586741.1 ABC transporter permease [Armatimonadota bacterium]
MASYIARRLLQVVVVVFGVSIFAFFIIFLRGDPVQFMIPVEHSTPELIEQVRREMGFADPLYVQYARFVWKAFHGDFGKSWQLHEPALRVVLHRVPATFQLGAAALLLAVVIGVPAGIIAAVKRGSMVDLFVTWMATIGRAVPNFWLSIMLILVFGVILQVLPISGRGTWMHLVMPAFVLGIESAATQMRLVRASLLEVLGQDYIRTARAKGVAEHLVILRHAMRNALIPPITILGLQVAFIFSGAVVVEQIFAWPGLGRLIVQSIFTKDMPIVQVAVIFLGLVVALMTLLVDILYTLIDPRIRFD